MSPRQATQSSRPAPERATAYSRTTSKRRKKSKRGWVMWWPVLVGIAVTPLARRAAAVLAMEGPGALGMLYPYVALLKLHLLGLPEDLGSNLSQAMMYLQFPLYGLFAALMIRYQGIVKALVWTVVVHVLPIGFLMIVSRS